MSWKDILNKDDSKHKDKSLRSFKTGLRKVIQETKSELIISINDFKLSSKSLYSQDCYRDLKKVRTLVNVLFDDLQKYRKPLS